MVTSIPSANMLFSCGADQTLRAWNLSTGQLISTLKLKYNLGSLAVHRDNLYGWTDGPKYWVYSFDLKSGTYCKFKGKKLAL